MFKVYKDNPALGSEEAYVPGLTPDYVSKTYGIPVDEVAKLGSAENPFGPSPRAQEVVMSARKMDKKASNFKPYFVKADNALCKY